MKKILLTISILFLTYSCTVFEEDLVKNGDLYYQKSKDIPFSGKVEIDEDHQAILSNGVISKIVRHEDYIEDLLVKNSDSTYKWGIDFPEFHNIIKRDSLSYLMGSNLPFHGSAVIRGDYGNDVYIATYENGRIIKHDFKRSIKLSPITERNDIIECEYGSCDVFFKPRIRQTNNGHITLDNQWKSNYFNISAGLLEQENISKDKKNTDNHEDYKYDFERLKITKMPDAFSFEAEIELTQKYTLYFDREITGEKNLGSYGAKFKVFNSLLEVREWFPRFKILGTSKGVENRWGTGVYDALNRQIHVRIYGTLEISDNIEFKILRGGYIKKPRKYNVIDVTKGSLKDNRLSLFLKDDINMGNYYSKFEANSKLRHGPWRLFTQDGKLLQEWIYDRGKLISNRKL